jgi:hypothetical protein
MLVSLMPKYICDILKRRKSHIYAESEEYRNGEDGGMRDE